MALMSYCVPWAKCTCSRINLFNRIIHDQANDEFESGIFTHIYTKCERNNNKRRRRNEEEIRMGLSVIWQAIDILWLFLHFAVATANVNFHFTRSEMSIFAMQWQLRSERENLINVQYSTYKKLTALGVKCSSTVCVQWLRVEQKKNKKNKLFNPDLNSDSLFCYSYHHIILWVFE